MSRWNMGLHFKMNFNWTVMFACLFFCVTADVLDPGFIPLRNEEWNKTAPQIHCIENKEYAHDGRCCRNCEAGTYVERPCQKDLDVGICAPCERGTYAEHATGMDRCLTCTPCRMDQEETEPCSKTQNRQCQCRPGSFCQTNGPCEVCKKCAKCKENEEKVQDCTPTSNTLCRKKYPLGPTVRSQPEDPTSVPPTDPSALAVAIPVTLFLILAAIAAGVGLWCWWRRRSVEGTETPSDASGEVKINMEEAPDGRSAGTEETHQPLLQETQELRVKSVPVEDEDRGLGDSLPNTTNSSQTSLSAPPNTPSCASSPRHSPAPRRLPPPSEERRLIPLNGEESLKKSFDIFEQFLGRKIHKRFFRAIGLSDNKIENAHPEDKVYELLKAWMQKRGREADINELLNTLRDLDHRFDAESISSIAVQKGYYRYLN